jgi:prepilin-type N-terminal cleavage/methylation domain-containing protein
MKRRSGFTLIEVLVAIFIMAIGLLALLTLFPLAALTMSKALQDDRAATCAYDAANICDAFDVRHDPQFQANDPTFGDSTTMNNMTVAYVDPNGALNSARVGASNLMFPATQGIKRITTLNNMTAPTGTTIAARYFTLLDDIGFTTSGAPDLSTGIIPRGDRYTWAYMLHRLQPGNPTSLIDLVVVVYAGRPTQVASGENTYPANGVQNSTSVTLDFTNNPPQPTIRRGTWILDTSFDPAANMMPTSNQQSNNQPVRGDFYRVVSVTPAGTTLNLELQTPLLRSISAVTVLDNVVEVFDRGAK